MILLVQLPYIIGISAGIFTSFSMLPQLMKMIKEKKVDDISVVMLLILLTGLALWVYYGILREDWPIILTNSFSFLLNGIIIVLRFKYQRSAKNKLI